VSTPTRRPGRFSWLAYVELLRARWSLLAALGALGLGCFVKLTSELQEGGLQLADQHWLEHIIALRVPAWNGHALDLTALGSGTVITLIVTIALFFLLVARDGRCALQLLLVSTGSAAWTNWLKHSLERQRPSAASRLAEVSSFSYPSGHSLASAAVYLTLAIIVARHMPTRTGRVGLFVVALILTLSIGASRAYIGVHFPSDVAAGLAFGWGWALLVSAVFSYLTAKAEQLRQSD
jgi:undecaprenyl-diphosphatase